MKITIIILTFLFLSCKSNRPLDKKNGSILYMFPVNVEKLISEYISKNKNTNYVIDLQKDNNEYVIYIAQNQNELNILTNNTSRKVIIDQKLIPIIFDYDSDFATLESYENVIKRLEENKNNNEPYIRQKKFTRIYDNVIFIRFNKKGDIVKQNIPPSNE